MKTIILSLTLIFSTSVFSQVTAGDGTINGIPLSWNIDIYSFLESSGSFPNLKNTPLYYFEVASQKVKFPELKNDPGDYTSTDRTVSVKPMNSKMTSIKPNGQIALPGDIVNMAYNQKLKLFIPSTGQFVWIGAKKKQGIQILTITKDASESDAAKVKALNTVKKTDLPQTTQQSPARPAKAQN